MIRVITTLLLFVYTLTSSGAKVYYHACGNKSQISLSEKNASHGSCEFCLEKEHHHHDESCGGEKTCHSKDSCCNDVQIELKNSDSQLSFNAMSDLSAFSPVETILYWIMVYTPWESLETQKTNEIFSFETPPISEQSTYLVNCNFRI